MSLFLHVHDSAVYIRTLITHTDSNLVLVIMLCSKHFFGNELYCKSHYAVIFASTC